ncbi:BON domain-containing protein [Polynucleobacter kasalickyi]|uniref:Osmotically-inducible protein OsmY, contains BON domain n=1 Tax=Polynucleobacter kasalickyi TaxID=1938817 RepID=A0A1W2BT78_9BURK|nr:BON domain-containing protein [Polynucleobacter kasalickyi]SMC76190.1 Osmotically-inducible protein OsmY, contains BON domain [Polynucleobacter kasalickyi]
MNLLNFLRSTAVLVGAVSILQGCFPIIAGSGLYGAMVLADRRPLSVTTIDRGIQLELEANIQNKVGTNAHLNVTVFNQKVLLTGEVPNQNYKNLVLQEANQQANVKKVFDEMKIAENSSAEDRLLDTSLFSLVKARFIATTDIPSNSMKIVVEAKRVYLMGVATELEAKAAATVASRASDSIKEVVKLFDIISEEEKKKLDSMGVPETKK